MRSVATALTPRVDVGQQLGRTGEGARGRERDRVVDRGLDLALDLVAPRRTEQRAHACQLVELQPRLGLALVAVAEPPVDVWADVLAPAVTLDLQKARAAALPAPFDPAAVARVS